MATLDQLKARIILEVDRDDLGPGGEAEQALIDAYMDAIDHYAGESFWFNRASGSAAVSAGTQAAAIPAGVRYPHAVSWNGELLRKVALGDIEHRAESGTPGLWAENEGAIQLWPKPAAAGTLAAYGLAAIGAPASGAASNIWTSEAAKLIVARSKVALFRMFKEYDAMQASQAEEMEALSRLRSETRRRGAIPLRSAGDEPWTGCAGWRIGDG